MYEKRNEMGSGGAQQPVLKFDDPLKRIVKEWSEEAREAALEARRRAGGGGGTPPPGGQRPQQPQQARPPQQQGAPPQQAKPPAPAPAAGGGHQPDETGKIPLTREVATKGASLAQRLVDADRAVEGAYDRRESAGKTKQGKPKAGAKARAERAEADANYNRATAAYREAREAADSWHKETGGLDPVQAWQAERGRPWPYYRVGQAEQNKYYIK